MTDTVEFASFFVERIKQCGVKYVFGVPGGASRLNTISETDTTNQITILSCKSPKPYPICCIEVDLAVGQARLHREGPGYRMGRKRQRAECGVCERRVREGQGHASGDHHNVRRR